MEKLIAIGIQASIFTLIFCLGLETRLNATGYLLRRPGLALRSLLSMNVLMPLIAATLAAAFHLHPAVEIALVALAVSPVPPLLPKKQMKAGGPAEYAFGLLVGEAMLAIILVPVSVALITKAFGVPVDIPSAAIAKVVLMSVLIPLIAGVAVYYLSPAFARRWAKPLSKIAVVLLIVSLLPVLLVSLPVMRTLIGNGTLAVAALFSVLGFATGHWLGGPENPNRTVLAFSTASRHPGVAVAIASIGFPQEKSAVAAILLVVIINAVVGAMYLSWRGQTTRETRSRRAA